MSLIFGSSDYLHAWMREHSDLEDLRPCECIGVVRQGRLVAAVAYNNYRERAGDIQMSMASTSPIWASREVIKALFGYPFFQLKCRRVTAITGVTNQPARAFLCRVGFIQEGTLREFLHGKDAAVYGMLRRECKWLEEFNGQIVPVAAAYA